MFQILSPEQANPGLYGASQVSNILGRILGNQQQAITNQYLPQKSLADILYTQKAAEQAGSTAKHLDVQTQYYPQDIMSQIGLRSSEANANNANAGKTNAEIGFEKWKSANPEEAALINSSGPAGQIGGVISILKHPEWLPRNQQQVSQPQGNEAYTLDNVLNKNPTDNGNMTLVSQANSGTINTPNTNTLGTVLNQSSNQNQQPASIIPKTGNPYADQILSSLTTTQDKNAALARINNARATGYNYMSLPVDQKSALIAQASGMGYDPQDATKLFMNGNTIADLANAKGLDPTNLPDPIYPTTRAALGQIQQRQQAASEIDKIQPILTNAIAPYSRRFAGQSPEFIADALKGENLDKQAQYLAAAALMPEMSAMRIRAMSGKQVGVEAIRDISNASMGNIKNFQSLISPEVYKKANQYVDRWINLGMKAANDSLLKTYSKQGQAAQISQNNFSAENDPLGIR